MASKERSFEKRTTNHVFRNPTLSSISFGENGETGRDFLTVGQKSTQIICSDPEMGGGCYTKVEYHGRIGVIRTNDAERSYIYIDADGRPEPLTIEEEIPYADALAALEDAEACGRFVTDSLVAVLDFNAQ